MRTTWAEYVPPRTLITAPAGTELQAWAIDLQGDELVPGLESLPDPLT
jgi:hypothetical protein